MAKQRVPITPEKLRQLYYVENRSAVQVAAFFGCTSTTIKNYLVKYDFRVKRPSEVMRGRKLTPEHRSKVIKTLKTGAKGKENPNWKGGRTYIGRKKDGQYVAILIDGKYIPEHRYVMQQYLNRKLSRSEEVHHINGVKTDNRIENLLVLSKSDHAKLHASDPEFNKRKSETMKARLSDEV
jgi:hypothetical protein